MPVFPSVHFDPLQWETPEKFNPDHFLDEKGHFRKRDDFMVFSAGIPLEQIGCVTNSHAQSIHVIFLPDTIPAGVLPK